MIKTTTKKVYCIKSNSSKYNDFKFKKGRIYDVIYRPDIDAVMPLTILDGRGSGRSFHESSYYNSHLVSEFFISIEEFRKLKLEKINEL